MTLKWGSFMNNEIKEILDKLNKNKNEIKDYCYYPDDILSCDDLIKLLDYLTNLQERIDKTIEKIKPKIELLEMNKQAIMRILEPSNGHLLVDVNYKLKVWNELLDILKGEDK